MIRNKKLVISFFIVLAVLLISISIAYAALSATITTTTNKITQQAMTWDIGFTPGTVTGEATVNNSGEVSCGSATATATTITGISVSLSGVGDECRYFLPVLNKGTIGGKISAINITKPSNTTCTIDGSTMVCGSITYKMERFGTNEKVKVGDTISKASYSGSNIVPSGMAIYLIITHTGTIASTTDYNQSGFAYNFTFSQN